MKVVTDFLTNLRRYLGALRHWIAEPRLVWALIATLGLALGVIVLLRTEQAARLTGLALELMGTVVVGVEIVKSLKAFDRPGYLARLASWLQRVPRWRIRVVTGTGSATLGSATATARGYATVVAIDPLSIPERLDAIEQNLKLMHGRISEADSRFTRDIQTLTTQMSEEAHVRAREHTALSRKLEETSIGGVDWAATGFVLVVVGALLNNLSQELAGYLSP